MENLDLKVTTNQKELFLGSHFHILEDKTNSTVNCFDMNSFLSSVKTPDHIFIDIKKLNIVAYEENYTVNKDLNPKAELTLSKSKQIILILSNLGKGLNLSGATKFLELLLQYADKNAISLKDHLKDLKIKKIVSIESKKDHNGNFLYTFQSSSSKEDYKFPEFISFNVPLLQNEKESIEIKLNVFFDYQIKEEPTINISFECISIDDVFEVAIKKFIETKLKGFNTKLGELALNIADDKWKYYHNAIENK